MVYALAGFVIGYFCYQLYSARQWRVDLNELTSMDDMRQLFERAR